MSASADDGAEALVGTPLTPEAVAHIHHDGGTMLGSSRGEQDLVEIVDALEANAIGILFAVGGDGTLRGALRIVAEIERRGDGQERQREAEGRGAVAA